MFSAEERKEVELFLALLFPWEDDDKDLWKSVTWSFIPASGDKAFANYATQSRDNLIRLIAKKARQANADCYVCLGTQRVASSEKIDADGFPKAIRQQKNIVSFKSIALDIDVKPGGYATTADAFAALDAFITRTGLPPATMEIYSGTGGLHVYWCTPRPMPYADWHPLAKALRDAALAAGLHFDPQVTVNPCGILRVPNTFNYKANPRAKVHLYREPGHTFPRYDYQQLVGALSNFMGGASIKPAQMKAGGAAVHNANFIDGVTESSPPVPIEAVAVNCPAIDDMLTRGGVGDSEPLWNLGLLAASFTSDPTAAAHALGNQDKRYTIAGTDKKLDEKVKARAANPSLGWPKCDAFSHLHPACKTCPMFALGKSPFNFADRQAQPAQPQSINTSQNFTSVGGGSDIMPEGYWRNKLGHVMTTLVSKAGDSYPTEIITYPVLDAGLNHTTNLLQYKAVIGGVPIWRSIDPGACMQPQAAATALAKGLGIMVPGKNHSAVRDFIVAWVSHLQTLRKDATQSFYGWSPDGKAFAFDDKIYRSIGAESVHRGKHHDPSFAVSGQLKPWQDAMQLIYGNPPLEAAVASAFAAPLVEMAGPMSTVLSVFSQASGVGKSTAMMLGQAVWGHPRTGMSILDDTTNSLMKKIGDLRSLPVYWDELRTKDQLDKIINLVFQVTQGKTKSRLTKDIEQAATSAFTTMFIIASNPGIADTVYSRTEQTEAGGLRVFEIEAQPLKATMTGYEASRLMSGLQTNYGAAGATYAEYLARHRPHIEAMIKKVSEGIAADNKMPSKERFWGMTMATLLVGAGLANNAGLTSFDLPAMRAYLDDMLIAQRNEMKAQEYATLSATADVVGLMQDLVWELRGKSVIVTDTVPYAQAGKPVPVTLIQTGVDENRLGDVWVQYGQNDGRLRIRVGPFKEWLRKRRLVAKSILKSLEGDYHVYQSKQSIGVGVQGLNATVIGRSECIDLTPLKPPTPRAPSRGSGGPN